MDFYITPSIKPAELSHVLENVSLHKSDINFKKVDIPPDEYARQKTVITPYYSHQSFNGLASAQHAIFIETNAHNFSQHLNWAIQNSKNFIGVFSSQSSYKNNLAQALTNLIQEKRIYSTHMLEVCLTILGELITNAVVHGNLNINIKFTPEEDPEEFIKGFAEIEDKLSMPDFASKAIIVTIDFFHDHLIFSIQDESKGFDFEAFQEKYKNSRHMIKGMDLVFLMSEDIDYLADENRLIVTVRDPEKNQINNNHIHTKTAKIGIVSHDKNAAQNLQEDILDLEVSQTTFFEYDTLSIDELIEKTNLIIILSDITAQNLKPLLINIREKASLVDLPILYQRSKNVDQDDIKKVSPYINDFFNQNYYKQELKNRIKVQYDMHISQHKFLEFFNHFQRELSFAERSIETLEEISSSFLPRDTDDNEFFAFIYGTKTKIKTLDDAKHDFEKQSNAFYGQGLCFSIAGAPYFLLATLNHAGLSPLIILSKIKGLLERIKGEKQHLTPSDIIDYVQSHIKALLPEYITLDLLCAQWDIANQQLIYDHEATFISFEHSFEKNTTKPVPSNLPHLENTSNKIYKPQETKALCIYSSFAAIDRKTVHDFILNMRTEDLLLSVDHAKKIQLLDSQNNMLPYFLLLPPAKDQRTQWK